MCIEDQREAIKGKLEAVLLKKRGGEEHTSRVEKKNGVGCRRRTLSFAF